VKAVAGPAVEVASLTDARQQGAALIELAMALALAILIASWAAQGVVHRFNDAQAQAAAVWMRTLHKAALSYVGRHAPGIQMASAPSDLAAEGYADWRAPKVEELMDAGLVPSGFPTVNGLAGEARVAVWTRGNCPGSDCIVEALVYGSRPLLKKGSEPDEAMIAQWLLGAEGFGAAVHPSDPDHLRGSAYALASVLDNGMALPVGTVGMAVTTEQQAFWNFLRVRDPRDPDLQGALTVAGDLNAASDVSLDGRLLIRSQAVAGARCDTDGALVQESNAGLLICRMWQWRPVSRIGGGYGHNSLYGCSSPDGLSTANPLTGGCFCPSYAMPFLLLDTGESSGPTGRQRAYLCVG
jgi:hypothetical protein